MHTNEVLFLLSIGKQDQEISPCMLLFQTVSARQGPWPGQVFSYSNRTKTSIPVLPIPGSFMEFPGSLHHLPLLLTIILFPLPLITTFFLLPSTSFFSQWHPSFWSSQPPALPSGFAPPFWCSPNVPCPPLQLVLGDKHISALL